MMLIRRISVRVSVFYHEKCLNIFIEEEENFRPILMAFPDSPRYFISGQTDLTKLYFQLFVTVHQPQTA